MLPVAVVWAGLILAGFGALNAVKPLGTFRFTRRLPRTRGAAAAVVVSGVLLAALGFALPAAESTVTQPRTRLDELAPRYQFHERHETEVAATPERVYEAIRSVTAGEIALFRTLTAIRRFGRRTPESILNPPEDRPILDVATRTGFLLLAAQAPTEVVVGTVVLAPRGFRRADAATPDWFRSFPGEGYAIATMSFRVEPGRGGRCRLTTETRVYATGLPARRRFAAYWRVIYPGSALIRRMWLRAIRLRAEARGAPVLLS